MWPHHAFGAGNQESICPSAEVLSTTDVNPTTPVVGGYHRCMGCKFEGALCRVCCDPADATMRPQTLPNDNEGKSGRIIAEGKVH